jgi:hypothetical protein
MGDRWDRFKGALGSNGASVEELEALDRDRPQFKLPEDMELNLERAINDARNITRTQPGSYTKPGMRHNPEPLQDPPPPPSLARPKGSQALADEVEDLETELERGKELIQKAEVHIAQKRRELHIAIEREREEELKAHGERLKELEALRPLAKGGEDEKVGDVIHGSGGPGDGPTGSVGPSGPDAGLSIVIAGSENESRTAPALPQG